MRIRFTTRYDHRWPSRAVTSYPEGWEGRVKKEVAEAALAKGRAEVVSSPDAAPAEAADSGRHIGLAERDDDADVGPDLRVPGDEPASKPERARRRR